MHWNSLPADVIRHNIYPYLGRGDWLKMGVTDQCHQLYLKSVWQRLEFKRYRELLRRFHPVVISLMGGLTAILNFPILDWNPRYNGGTGYIDNIPGTDLEGHGVMIGFDETYQRPFIVIQTVYQEVSSSGITVLFQRYGDDSSTWAQSHCGPGGFICESGHFMRRGVIRHDLLAANLCHLLVGRGYVYRYKMGTQSEELQQIHGIRLGS